ncbi:Fatty acid metabolism regulator protein [BD1-7 clade bacterium]|uniref:Fatty acid metabolism regulator protein n=1 Tax=BD1-7 clade bacterium TaxID=2029982 RepID=A0A5S9PZV6_9GAMM|nr:Fatty acid metabolism regulator protein [BD1-7 clade bacterium]CAA0112798.1 Fatty acid metabolism regulator protein [BD1-7 clade bacterium]
MAPAPKFTPEQQESMILEAAANAIEASSLLDFTMSTIAKEAGISMGSVYKHVQTKEDVLVALATESLHFLTDRIAEILALDLSVPERLAAVLLGDHKKIYRRSFDPQLETLVMQKPLLERSSNQWRERLFAAQARIDRTFMTLLEAAIDDNELIVGDNRSEILNQLMLGNWALNVGFHHVSVQTEGVSVYHGDDAWSAPYKPTCAQVQTFKAVVNAVQWRKPLDDDGIARACDALVEMGLR